MTGLAGGAKRVAVCASLGALVVWVAATSASSVAPSMLFHLDGGAAGYTDSLPTPLLSLNGLLPGQSLSAVVRVRNATKAARWLRVDLGSGGGCGSTPKLPCPVATAQPYLHLTVTPAGTALSILDVDLATRTSQTGLAIQLQAGVESVQRVTVSLSAVAGNALMARPVKLDLQWSLYDAPEKRQPDGSDDDRGKQKDDDHESESGAGEH